MIIFGWKTREKVSHVQRSKCPVCQTDRDINFLTNKVWFTLFFIPIFPIRTTGYQNVCSHCGSVFPAPVRESSSPPDSLSFSKTPQPSQTSATAIVSFVLAILSPVLICLCFSSIPASIVSIVLGHLSLSKIAKSDGLMNGRGLSIASLALAYPVLVGSITLMSFSLVRILDRNNSQEMNSTETRLTNQDGFPMDSDADAQSRFQAAERQILALQGDSPGRGNSPEATRMAQSFAEMMLEVRESAFSNGKKPLFQLSSGQFVTYVELHQDRALFLVHVPEYRKFTKEAKEQLTKLAWTVAQLTVKDSLPEDAQLAVALKGTVLYGNIMTGYVTKVAGLRDNYLPGKKGDLLAFFPVQSREQKPFETTAEPRRDVGVADQLTTSEVLKTTTAPPLSELPDTELTVRTEANDLASDTSSTILSRPFSEPPPARPIRERFEPFDPKLSITPTVKIPKNSWGYESMAWSHHGKWLAAGKIDDTLTLFDASSGKIISEVKKLADLNYFSALTFSFDDRFLVAATNSGETAMFEIDPQGHLKHVGAMFRHAKGACVLASSPRYPFVASGGKDGTIAWQKLAIPSQTKLLQHLKREPLGIKVPAEGTNALAINGETWIQFSLRDASIVAEHSVGVRSARSGSISPDSSQYVLVDYQNIYWSDFRDRVPAVKIHNAKRDSLTSVVFHPNNRWIAVSGRGNVLILDVVDREPLARVTFESSASVKCLQFSPDGTRLAVSFQSSDANIHVFDIQEL